MTSYSQDNIKSILTEVEKLESMKKENDQILTLVDNFFRQNNYISILPNASLVKKVATLIETSFLRSERGDTAAKENLELKEKLESRNKVILEQAQLIKELETKNKSFGVLRNEKKRPLSVDDELQNTADNLKDNNSMSTPSFSNSQLKMTRMSDNGSSSTQPGDNTNGEKILGPELLMKIVTSDIFKARVTKIVHNFMSIRTDYVSQIGKSD